MNHYLESLIIEKKQRPDDLACEIEYCCKKDTYIYMAERILQCLAGHSIEINGISYQLRVIYEVI